MKKLLKSKKFYLALLAVILVSSMILAGTYAWFVKTGDIDINGGDGDTAELTAAYFEVPETSITFDVGLTPKGISLYVDLYPNAERPLVKDVWNEVLGTDLVLVENSIYNDDISYWAYPGGFADFSNPDKAYVDKVPALNYASNSMRILPGEGAEFTVDFEADSATALLDFANNRDIVVEIDLSGVLSSFGVDASDLYDAAEEAGATSDDIWINPVSGSVSAGAGKYYRYVPAGELLDIDDIIAAISDTATIEVGIIGHGHQQEHYMTEGLTVYLDDIADGVASITAVQATEQAVIDVFGPDAWDIALDQMLDIIDDFADELYAYIDGRDDSLNDLVDELSDLWNDLVDAGIKDTELDDDPVYMQYLLASEYLLEIYMAHLINDGIYYDWSPNGNLFTVGTPITPSDISFVLGLIDEAKIAISDLIAELELLLP